MSTKNDISFVFNVKLLDKAVTLEEYSHDRFSVAEWEWPKTRKHDINYGTDKHFPVSMTKNNKYMLTLRSWHF